MSASFSSASMRCDLVAEMPHDHVADFCIAALWMSYVSAALQSASLRNWAPAGVDPLGLS